ncbi:MAG: YncE family protein, partial [marine benthic group bacterium]|nr:YncE family protein [Gemmatimonadota bacterium]
MKHRFLNALALLLIAAVSGCDGIYNPPLADSQNPGTPIPPVTYTVGGTVSGLTGTVALLNNGGDGLSVSADGGFTFATPLADGAGYAVTVGTQPAGQTCEVASGTGTI